MIGEAPQLDWVNMTALLGALAAAIENESAAEVEEAVEALAEAIQCDLLLCGREPWSNR